MRLFFFLAAALCWLNAALVSWDMLNVPMPLYAVSVTLIVIFLGCGWLVYRLQFHLYRSFHGIAALRDHEAAAFKVSIEGLGVWLVTFAVTVTFVALLSLIGIVSRFREGFTLFG